MLKAKFGAHKYATVVFVWELAFSETNLTSSGKTFFVLQGMQTSCAGSLSWKFSRNVYAGWEDSQSILFELDSQVGSIYDLFCESV